MKKTALLALCALPLAYAQAQAVEFTSEPAATAYWQIPLAVSKTGKEQQAFGFRLDQVMRDNTGNLVSSFSAPQRAAAVDFRFNDKGLSGVYVHGVNMATPAVMKAAGGDDMVWWIVGGTVAGMVGLAIWADDKGGSECASGPVFTLNTAPVPVCGNPI
jgi:hypothetical protein